MTKVGFCAVGGSGMSALAQVLKFNGIEVYGSDRDFDQGKNLNTKQSLQSVGIKICSQDGSMLENNISTLYVSSAVEDTIPDVKKAKEQGIAIKKRSDLLAQIFAQHQYGIAVGGTSGKSTVTAMIGYVLDKSGYKPLVINGAILNNYKQQKGIANVVLNKGNLSVIEADESDGSIEKYTPSISVINNITLDHKPIPELQKLFFDFAAKAKKGAVINLDCPNSKPLLQSNPNITTFSITDSKATFFASDITAEIDGTSYIHNGQKYKLLLIGRFNVLNAMAAVAACSLMGIAPHQSCEILQNFTGTKRRLDVLGNTKGITVIDDFAHNPDKVLASMSALKSYSGRLIIMFQPHGFAPMRLMGRQIIESFVSQMSDNDILLMPEIYFSGGSVTKDISSANLVEYAVNLGKKAMFFENRADLLQHILSIAKSGDRIVLMGARDNSITDMGYQILEELK